MNLVSDMTPSLPVYDPGNIALAHAITIRQCLLSYAVGISLADNEDFRFGKLCAGISLSFGMRRWLASALSKHIFHVISMRSKPEMIQSDARWVVTAMQHMQSAWNTAVGDQPRNSMCCCDFASDAELAVTKAIFTGSPFPARISLSHLRPIEFFHGLRIWRRTTAFFIATSAIIRTFRLFADHHLLVAQGVCKCS